MFGVVTSVATARPAAAVRPGASARAATAAARPGAHARARLAVPRARVLARASARLPAVAAVAAPLAFVSPAVRRASSRRAPLRRARGGSLVAGGAEKSSSAESSTAVASDDVDALAERLDKLKEKSRAMLAEAEALEKSVTDEKNDKAETSAGGASATEAETAATSKQTPAASSSTTVKKLDPNSGDGKEATAKKTKAEPCAGRWEARGGVPGGGRGHRGYVPTDSHDPREVFRGRSGDRDGAAGAPEDERAARIDTRAKALRILKSRLFHTFVFP
jgi:hypothetical protein